MPGTATIEKGTEVEETSESWNMPHLQTTTKPKASKMQAESVGVLAILVGDLHLQEQPPIGRSAEPDWFKAMERPLREIRTLQRKYNCPVILPGDIFNKWNSSPILINWAIEQFKGWYSVAGNHDLPLHNYQDLKKSAYWTLVKAKSLIHLELKNCLYIFEDDNRPNLSMIGFSHGQDYSKWRVPHKAKGTFHLAVVHDYCWQSGHSFPGAPESKHISQHAKVLQQNGFDAAVFGDNHKGHAYIAKGISVVNPGTVMCRTNDERDYHPFVGLLLESGVIIPKALEVSEDKWTDNESIEGIEEETDNREFIKELLTLGDASLNFGKALEKVMKTGKTNADVKGIVLTYLEKFNG